MNARLAFALIAFAVIVIAAAAVFAPSARKADTVELGLALPSLAAQLNDQQTIELADVEGALTLQRQDGAWVLAGLPGLPVDQGKVREFLLGLAAVKLVEAKTSDPAFHDALELGKGSTRILLGEGAGLLVGKAAVSSGYFVRRVGEDQTYIAKPLNVPDVAVKAWSDVSVPVAKKDLVTRVEVRDGIAPYEVRLEGGALSLVGLREGEELAYDGVLETVTGGAVYIEFEDVRLADQFDWSGAGQSSFHGASKEDTLTFTLLDAEGGLWLRAQPSGVFVPEGDVEWARWAFQISDYRKDTLLKPRADLIKADAPVAP